MEEKKEYYPGISYKELSDYMQDNHNVVLIESEMQELIRFIHENYTHLLAVQSSPVWVNCSERMPEPQDIKLLTVKWHQGVPSHYCVGALTANQLADRVKQNVGFVYLWLDETGTANALPTFWDVAKAFKWAAEYNNEKGEQLSLLTGQWTLIREDEENENETEDITPGNVAELYCLQNGFTKEIDGTATPNNEQTGEWSSNRLAGRVKERFKELEEKQHDWRSFYNGWLEGRADMLQQIKGWGKYKK